MQRDTSLFRTSQVRIQNACSLAWESRSANRFVLAGNSRSDRHNSFDISTTRQEDLDALERLSSIALTEKMFVFLMSNNLDDDILCIAKANRAIAIEKKPNSQYKIDLVIDRMVSVCTEITTESYVLDC